MYNLVITINNSSLSVNNLVKTIENLTGVKSKERELTQIDGKETIIYKSDNNAYFWEIKLDVSVKDIRKETLDANITISQDCVINILGESTLLSIKDGKEIPIILTDSIKRDFKKLENSNEIDFSKELPKKKRGRKPKIKNEEETVTSLPNKKSNESVKYFTTSIAIPSKISIMTCLHKKFKILFPEIDFAWRIEGEVFYAVDMANQNSLNIEISLKDNQYKLRSDFVQLIISLTREQVLTLFGANVEISDKELQKEFELLLPGFITFASDLS